MHQIKEEWYWITTDNVVYEDMQFKGKVSDNFYWKLSAQCRARIPMLKSIYNKLKKQYD